MQAPLQSLHASFLQPSDILNSFSGTKPNRNSLVSLKGREEIISTVVKKWFGALNLLKPKARAIERARREPFLQPLLQLHRLGCDLVPAHQRIPLAEQDICSAIKILNLLAITIRCKPAIIVAYCEARARQENNLRANQLDPLQLRHLLAFHQSIPSEELGALNIQALENACAKSDKKGIRTWFKTIAIRKKSLPKDTPQLLRQLILDLWNAGHRNFLDTFAAELAVLDCAMFDSLGWENSRLFLAVFKRIHGSACHSATAFIDKGEINVALEMYEQLKHTDQINHFRTLSTAYDTEALRRLELAINHASKEKDTRIRNAYLFPIAQKKIVRYPVLSKITDLFAQRNFKTAS
jgi:hypothetical protein